MLRIRQINPRCRYRFLFLCALMALPLAHCFGEDTPSDPQATESDADGDGSSSVSVGGEDCNDSDSTISPTSTEICDDIDNDCDGSVDEGVALTYYADADGDGYGDPAVSATACAAPAQTVTNSGDCNDTSASQYPGTAEVCDGLDNNCDGALLSDEVDSDGDGVFVCQNDCNDSNAAQFPGTAEVACNGIDDNCDGALSSGEVDSDGDLSMVCNGDCNDSDTTVYPSATELCDAKDNDCDGVFDAVDDGNGDWQRSVCASIERSNPTTENGVDQASVLYNPDLNIYQMWFRIVMASGAHSIGYATSDDGVNWTQYALPVLSPNLDGAWDGSKLGFPSVVYRNGSYYMWYQGHPSTGSIKIGYASSVDGIAWTRSPSNPVLSVGTAGTWDSSLVQAPSVLYDETAGKYKMWYTGSNGTYLRTGYAESTDGLSWTKESSNPVLDVGDSVTNEWDSKRAIFARVHFYEGEYHLWYSGDSVNQNNNSYEIGHATSSDGIVWTKQGAPVFSTDATLYSNFDAFSVYASDVVALDEGYAMIYSGNPCSTSACTGSTTPYAMGIAVSPTLVP